MSETGYLVTFEGPDGSGKTTAWDHLQQNLAPDDDFPGPNPFVFTREPTDTWYGEMVDEVTTREDPNPFSELFLFMADHANHLSSTVQPALEDGRYVICDRYIDSRCAYQATSLEDRVNNPLAFIRQAHEPWSRIPDLTIYFDVPADVGAKRSADGNRFEKAAFLESVIENYETLRNQESKRFVRVDATQDPDTVFSEVSKHIARTARSHFDDSMSFL